MIYYIRGEDIALAGSDLPSSGWICTKLRLMLYILSLLQ